MSMELITPNENYLMSVCEAIEEYKSEPSKFEINDVKKMIAARNNFADYFQSIKNNASGIGLKPNYVAQTTYWLIENEQYIGTFCLRHKLTPNLEKKGGHIAYQIRPSKYRMGYAYNGLRLCLTKAFQKGIEKALITCNSKNIASYNLLRKAMYEYNGTEVPDIEINGGREKRIWLHTHK